MPLTTIARLIVVTIRIHKKNTIIRIAKNIMDLLPYSSEEVEFDHYLNESEDQGKESWCQIFLTNHIYLFFRPILKY